MNHYVVIGHNGLWVGAVAHGIFGTVYALFFINELGFKPGPLGLIYATGGAASQPQLAAGGGTLNLAWTQDRLPGVAGEAMAIFAARLSGSTFVTQLPGDETFNGTSM